ncbi:hypothetical protein MED121_08448 [Marinomonas sp. MED121]|uniref:eCIS core domain-containing protein n=1 Tax=Marinomonas sp. MED121 TaxID=314277 RepID=UPI00006900C8|nr:DUF4157 domain-containing protein [Marinomonas sp. MED121]EAQ65580.1 hypothetical protein MED121_08448 [Marinomonas sp. MED121]
MINKQDRKINATHSLPNKIKSAFEYLSGYSLEDIRVHYDSDKPRKIGAHAYAQGHDIYLAPGKEEHLAHEAWHIVQQKQGRVKATTDINGILVNNDAALEQEADTMAAKIASFSLGNLAKKTVQLFTPVHAISVAQLALDPAVEGVDEVDEDFKGMVTIINPLLPEDSPLRSRSRKAIAKDKENLVTLKSIDEIVHWLESDISEAAKEALEAAKRLNKPLPYYKVKKGEKAYFMEKLKRLESINFDDWNDHFATKETKYFLPLNAIGIPRDINPDENIEIENFTISRPVTSLFFNPYVAMTPFTEDFERYIPHPGKLGINPFDIRNLTEKKKSKGIKDNQVICATSAMATLTHCIVATDYRNPSEESSDSSVHVQQFVHWTNKKEQQLNAGSLEMAKGFAVGLSHEDQDLDKTNPTFNYYISPIFNCKSSIDKHNGNLIPMKKSKDSLNSFFWATIFPNLKAGASIYVLYGYNHVISLIKTGEDSYIRIESNKAPNRGIYMNPLKISTRTARGKDDVGTGFIIAQKESYPEDYFEGYTP